MLFANILNFNEQNTHVSECVRAEERLGPTGDFLTPKIGRTVFQGFDDDLRAHEGLE